MFSNKLTCHVFPSNAFNSLLREAAPWEKSMWHWRALPQHSIKDGGLPLTGLLHMTFRVLAGVPNFYTGGSYPIISTTCFCGHFWANKIWLQAFFLTSNKPKLEKLLNVAPFQTHKLYDSRWPHHSKSTKFLGLVEVNLWNMYLPLKSMKVISIILGSAFFNVFWTVPILLSLKYCLSYVIHHLHVEYGEIFFTVNIC